MAHLGLSRAIQLRREEVPHLSQRARTVTVIEDRAVGLGRIGEQIRGAAARIGPLGLEKFLRAIGAEEVGKVEVHIGDLADRLLKMSLVVPRVLRSQQRCDFGIVA